MRARNWILPIISILLPYVVFEILRSEPALDRKLIMPVGHFTIVSIVSFLSAIVAIAIGVVGNRLRNTKVVLLSLSFLSLSVLLTVHGLSTPHFILDQTHLPSVAAPFSILLAVIWLWLSSLPSDSPMVRFISQYVQYLLPVWSGFLVLLGSVGMLFPDVVQFIPLHVHPLNWGVSLFVIVVSFLTMIRYYRSYLYSRFPLQIAIVFSAAWMIVAQLVMVMGELWRISWWYYHFLLLGSMIVMVVGLYRQYADKQSLVGAMRSLFTTDPVERITCSISPSIRALMMATEKKDKYTAGHNLRVALYALQLGEELNLMPDQLRAIAQGTIIHDVGKIDIPDAILNKPGKLTSEERLVIETHPLKGYDMCRTLGFMKEELEIIRSHHERWDGKGYPDGLSGEQIPLMARIVAVVDVYDALTSERAYRKAMLHHEAIAYLVNQKGCHFDPVCIDAWVRVCERNPTIYPFPTDILEKGEKDWAYIPISQTS